MQKLVVKVGHPDPEEAAKRGLKTAGVVIRDLTPREIAKREHAAALEVAREETRVQRAAVRAELKRGLPADLAVIERTQPELGRILRYLLG